MLLALTTFAAAAALIVMLPGPDTMVMVRSLVRGGRPRGLATALGILTGLTVWVCAAALGLSALLEASKLGYDVLRLVGAAYLIWLGVGSLVLRRSRLVESDPGRPSGRPCGRPSGRGGFVAGLTTDLLNPKVGVFFVSFLPGFVPAGASVGWTTLAFGAVFVIETAIYCAVLVLLAGRVTTWINRPRTRRRLDAITGVVLIAFGLRLAIEP